MKPSSTAYVLLGAFLALLVISCVGADEKNTQTETKTDDSNEVADQMQYGGGWGGGRGGWGGGRGGWGGGWGGGRGGWGGGGWGGRGGWGGGGWGGGGRGGWGGGGWGAGQAQP